MKITQSIVVASLSVAAHSSVASPLPDSTEHLLSARAPKVGLDGAKPSRVVSRGLGRRAPSQPPSDSPQNDIVQPGSPVSDAVNLATGATGDLRATSGPLSGPVGSALSKVLGTAADTLQGAPVVGDLTKTLPLDALTQGDPLAGVIGVASGAVGGLPVVGSPLADTLKTTASLTQALPLSLAVVPENRAVVAPTYSYNQVPVTASLLSAAGGAFPLQPSISLDGATLPYNLDTPFPQAETLGDKFSAQPQGNSQVQKQQYPEDYQTEETPQHTQMDGTSDEDGHGEDFPDDDHFHTQEISEDDSDEYSSFLRGDSAANSRALLTQIPQQAANPNLPSVPTNDGSQTPATNTLPDPNFPNVPNSESAQPPTAKSSNIATTSKDPFPSSDRPSIPKPWKRSLPVSFFRREGPSKRSLASILSPIEHGDSDTEETALLKANISLKHQRKASGSLILRRWWNSQSFKVSKS